MNIRRYWNNDVTFTDCIYYQYFLKNSNAVMKIPEKAKKNPHYDNIPKNSKYDENFTK